MMVKNKIYYSFLFVYINIVLYVGRSKEQSVLYFPLSSKGAVWKIKKSMSLIFLVHRTFQKVEIAFLHKALH